MRRLARGTVFPAGAILLATTLIACGARPFAEGGSRELTVISSLPPDAPELLLLRAIVERPALQIDDERAYDVRLAAPDQPRAFRATNVLVVGHGPIESIPAAARDLARLLGDPARPFGFVPDLWRRGQSVGIVWTRSRREWIPAVSAAQNRLFLELDRSTFAAVRERVHALPRNAAAERGLRDSLGIALSVPRGYEVRIDRAHGAALLLDPGPPARLLRVRAVDADTGRDLLESRARLARLFRPDERTLDRPDPLLVPDEMAGAVRRLHGHWEDGRASAGGPFRFYEVARGARRFHVDLAVFAPGRPKLPLLRELQVVAETLSRP